MIELIITAILSFAVGIGIARTRGSRPADRVATNTRQTKSDLDSNKWLEAMTNQLDDGIVAFDREGIIQFVSCPALSLLDWDGSATIGCQITETSIGDSLKERIRRFIDHATQSPDQNLMKQHRNEVAYLKNGVAQPLSVSLKYTACEGQHYFSLVLGNVSWRRHVEQQIVLSDSIKTGILESSVSAVIAINDKDQILEFNPSAERLFGYEREDVLGKEMPYLIMPERFHEAHRMGMKHYRNTGEGPVLSQKIQIFAVDSKHREFPIEIVITALPNAGKNIFTAVIDDITDRIEATKKLEQAKNSANRANEQKSRFLASMSHEIRTPLNVILGMVDLLQGSPLSDQQKQFIVSAENAGRNLLEMINDILDLSKIEAGHMAPSISEFDPVKVFEESVLMFRQRCWSSNLRLFIVVENNLPDLVMTDISFYRQIITNLISNAVKYTRSGSITARLHTEKLHGYVQLVVSITDTGPGISAENLPTVFEEFTQVHDREDGTTGTGLGLVICRQLANLIGGDISASSTLGQGSVFSFQLPLFSEKLAIHSYPCNGLHAYLYSNDLHWQSQVSAQLNQWGLTTKNFTDQESETPDKLPDLILIDNESVTRIPLNERFDFEKSKFDQIPLICIIENNSNPVIGFEYLYSVIQQPAPRQKLNSTLSAISIGQPIDGIDQPRVMNADRAINKPGQVAVIKGRLLLVEDSEANRMIAQSYLESGGYYVAEAVDGQDAVNLLSNESFDLILMDMRMPVMGGVEATRIIRSQNLAPNTPIIALTAHALVEVREECLEVGMQDFLTKPIDKTLLLDTVEQWIQKVREPVDQDVQEVIRTTAEQAAEILSKQHLAQLAQDTSPATLVKMVVVFRTEIQKRVAALSDLIAADDWGQVETSVHAIKSSAQTFGALRLSNLAMQAETFCRDNNQKAAKERCLALPELVGLTMQALDEFEANSEL